MSWLQEARRDQQEKEKSAKLAAKLAERERRGQCEVWAKKAIELLPKWRTLEIDKILVDLRNQIWPKTGRVLEGSLWKSNGALARWETPGNDVAELEIALPTESGHYFIGVGWTLRGKYRNAVDEMIKKSVDPLSIRDAALKRTIREWNWGNPHFGLALAYERWLPRDIFTISLYKDRLEAAGIFLDGTKQIPLDETLNSGGLREQVAQWIMGNKAP